MTKLRFLTTIRCLILAVLVLPPNLWAEERPPILETVARTYGLDSWNQIEAIRYTWSLQLGALNLARSWEWEPKTGKVSYEGPGKDGKPIQVTYMRSDMNDDLKKQTDADFTNDNYWLLFPLHAYWDTSATVTDEGVKKLPTGAGSGTFGVGEVWSRTRRLHAR